MARASRVHVGERGANRSPVVWGSLGKVATPFMGSHVTAKWGLHGLVRTLQVEARATPGIRISLVPDGTGNVVEPSIRRARRAGHLAPRHPVAVHRQEGP